MVIPPNTNNENNSTNDEGPKDPGQWDVFGTNIKIFITTLNEHIKNKFPDIGVINKKGVDVLISKIQIKDGKIEKIIHPESTKKIIEDIFEKINLINEKERELAPAGSGTITEYSKLLDYEQLNYILKGKHELLTPRDVIQSTPIIGKNEDDVKFIFTHHAYSCENFKGEYNIRDDSENASISLYGILQAQFKHKYDKDGSYIVDGKQSKSYYTIDENERVYVSWSNITWQTAVLLYLPNLKLNVPLELEILPFLNSQKTYISHLPSAIKNFKKFLEYLSILSKDIRDLYTGRTIKLYCLDVLVVFEIKKGGSTQSNNDEKKKYETGYGIIPDIDYGFILKNNQLLTPTAYDVITPGSIEKVKNDNTGQSGSSLVYKPYVKVCLYNQDGTKYSGNIRIKDSKFSEKLKREDIIRIRDYEVHTMNTFKKDFTLSKRDFQRLYVEHEDTPSQNVRQQGGEQKLHDLIRNNNVDKVNELLNGPGNVDVNEEFGYETPLYIACSNGNLELVKTLINKGADIDRLVNRSISPLFIASKLGKLDVVNMLIEEGADINKTGDNTRNYGTPLFVASKLGKVDVVKILIDKGADINKGDMDELTPLHVASKSGHVDVVNMLINAGADIDKSGMYNTPLRIAIDEGHLNVVKILIEAGADINNLGKNGLTPGTVVLNENYKHEDVIKFLKEITVKRLQKDNENKKNQSRSELQEDMALQYLVQKDNPQPVSQSPITNSMKSYKRQQQRQQQRQSVQTRTNEAYNIVKGMNQLDNKRQYSKFRFEITEKNQYDSGEYSGILENYKQQYGKMTLYRKNKNIPSFIKFYTEQISNKSKIVRCISHGVIMQEFVSLLNINNNYIDTKKKDNILKNHNTWDLVFTYNKEKKAITSVEIRPGIYEPKLKKSIQKRTMMNPIKTSSTGLVYACEELCGIKVRDTNTKCTDGIKKKMNYIHIGNDNYTSLHALKNTKKGGMKMNRRRTRKINKKSRITKKNNKKRNNRRKTRHNKK